MSIEKFYLGGDWKSSNQLKDILNPYDGSNIGEVCLASDEDLDKAIELSQTAFQVTKDLLSFEKEAIIQQLIDGIFSLKEEFVDTIILESGKPRRYAEGEVNRALQCLKVAKEECKRINGEIIDLSWTNVGSKKKGFVESFPIGIVAGITPFNFPLNLVMHKVAPALATGCPIIIKPASKTPLTALLLAKVISNTDWPKEAFSVLPCTRDTGNRLVEDERIKLLSFTGSPSVGWKMKANAGKKKVVLELGGNAAAIVNKDANIDEVISKLIIGCFAYSGQVCIHTQQVFVHEDLFELFMQRFIAESESLVKGDPFTPECEVGPMISEKEAKRTMDWIQEAVENGASVITGNKQDGLLVSPTILTNCNSTMKVVCEEVFAPVVVVEKFKSMNHVIDQVNSSKFGLQAALFTNDHTIVKEVFSSLDVGAVVLNDSTTFRADHMPYGGIKDSGIGREGVKYAMQDMLETKMLID